MANEQTQPDALALANSVKFAIQHRDEEIERLQARNEVLEGKLQRIEQWSAAYPRTVFIEPTDDEWKRANEVLNITDSCPSLTAISGSNMRHVVEGIAAIAAAQEVKA